MNRLKEIRESQGIVLAALLAKSRVAISTISAIEKHDYCPNATTRYRLARALGVTEADIWPDLATTLSEEEQKRKAVNSLPQS